VFLCALFVRAFSTVNSSKAKQSTLVLITNVALQTHQAHLQAHQAHQAHLQAHQAHQTFKASHNN